MPYKHYFLFTLILLRVLCPGFSAPIVVEGEKPASQQMTRHPWWYDKVKRDQLSGGDFISNFSKEKEGRAEYRFIVPRAGAYEFWVHANPVKCKLGWVLNGAPEKEINFTRNVTEQVNIAEDAKPDLRFIAWAKAGTVDLKAGENVIQFRMFGPQDNHGILDCFLFSQEPLQPADLIKAGQGTGVATRAVSMEKGWLPWNPKPDNFAESPISLRGLNEKYAGEHGFIGVKNGQFVRQNDGQAVRFWAVNGPSSEEGASEQIRHAAQVLAKHGVNLVRSHGAMFDKLGNGDPNKVKHAIQVVEEMKNEGIYTHLSVYFPLWFTPSADHPWLKGYDGKKHPFAVHMFNPQFIEKYQSWWKTLLLSPNEKTGQRLVDEPALFGVELVNEDSFFFWTFSEQNIPDPQLKFLENMFGDWLVKRYGSLDKAITKWGGLKHKRDVLPEGRVAFRPLYNIFNEKQPRDMDTVRFLYEFQARFYSDTIQYLRKLGFKGLITPSNWATASPEVFGPLEKMCYTLGDFTDRHGYFECGHKGENAEWSIRDGHTYFDRSALRFDAPGLNKPKQFMHPIMDIKYADKPSMISETTFTRPNRYRTEAVLYYAVYGALQASDAIVHFAFDGAEWKVKPRYWMQQWTLMSPVMMGQFPAAALIYRQSLVTPGAVVAEVDLNRNDLFALKGTPLPQDAAFDELRLKDVPEGGATVTPGQRLDPLLHYVGQTKVRFVDTPGQVKVSAMKPFIDRPHQVVSSSHGELKLDYGKGVLTFHAQQAQGVCGALKAQGRTDLPDIVITSELELGCVVMVSLDGRPLSTSTRILLQAMSEEQNNGFQTEPAANGLKRIIKIGRDPWQFKELQGNVKLKRSDASGMKVTALDLNGYPIGLAGTADDIKLQSGTVYYLLHR